jgi:hypothetical protein
MAQTWLNTEHGVLVSLREKLKHVQRLENSGNITLFYCLLSAFRFYVITFEQNFKVGGRQTN